MPIFTECLVVNGLRRSGLLLALFLALLLAMSITSVRAADITFDGRVVAGCTLVASTSTYTCGASPSTASDDLTVAVNYTVNVGADVSSSTAALAASAGFNGNLTVGSTLAIGAGAYVNGRLSVGTTLALGANSHVNGAVSVGTTLALGADTYVNGTVSAGTTVALGVDAYINGTVSAGTTVALGERAYISGNTVAGTTIFLGAKSHIIGDVQSRTASVTLDVSAYVKGSTYAGTTTTIGADAYVLGDMHSGTTGTLGAGGFVCGNVIVKDTVTVGAGGFVCGDLTSTTVTIGANGYVNGRLSATTATLGFGTCYGSITVLTLTDSGDGVCPLPRPSNGCSQSASSSPDHLLITHAGTALTCTPQTVSVTACANAACTLPYYSGGLNVTLNPGGQTFAIDASGVNNNAQVTQTTAGTTTLSASASIAAMQATTCRNVTTNSASCAMTYADAGFLFQPPDHAAETWQSLTISAVKKADNSLACVPAFSGLRKVNLTCGYRDPGQGTLPLRIRANGANGLPLAPDVLSSCSSAGVDFALNFDATGVAPISLIYADAGQTLLAARFVPGTAVDAGLVMTGTSSFTVAPASFGFSQIRKTGSPSLVNPAATNSAGSLFVKASEPFSATITALNSIGNATPNFGNESTRQRIRVSGTLVAPAGGSPGVFTASDTTPLGNGASGVVLSWNEVGIIQLNAALNSPGYLGSAMTVSGSSGNVGRFYPDHFVSTLTQACSAGNFSYSGQPFALQVSALNGDAIPALTQNYAAPDAFSKGVTLTDATASIAGALTNKFIAGTAFAAGQARTTIPFFTFANQAGNRQSQPTNIIIRAVDSDGVSSASFSEGSTEIRAGRLQILNAHGSQLTTLLMPMQTQYWTGNSWVINPADVCTGDPKIANNAVTLRFSDTDALACVLDGGSPGSSGAGCAAAAPLARQFIRGGNIGFKGDFHLALKVQVAGTSGKTTVSALVPAWLQFNWRGAGVIDPSARASFGLYKSGPLIYMRERY